MIFWGINALNHGSSLAIFNNGELISLSVCEEDKLTDSVITEALCYGYPNRVFWYEKPLLKKIRQVYAGQYLTALDMSVIPKRYLNSIKLLKVPITYTPHHASHAAAGYYTSPFNNCAVVVIDAIGEFESATIWNCSHGVMKKVWNRHYPHSLGIFYSAFTKLIGFTPIKDEHLLQKMSDQGDANKYYLLVKEYMNDLLSMPKNLHRGVLDWSFSINDLQDKRDIAASVQLVFEEQISLIMKKARCLTGSNNLVYMGGCAMNSKCNAKEIPKWEYAWSLPNPGDSSSSVGAVLYHTMQRQIKYHWGLVKHLEIKI
jgi:carbamoyltransferase